MKKRTILCLMLAVLLSFGGISFAEETEAPFSEAAFVTNEDATSDFEADYFSATQKRNTEAILYLNGQTYTESGSVSGATFTFGESNITLELNGYTQEAYSVSGTSAYGIYTNRPLFLAVRGENNITIAPTEETVTMRAGIYSTGGITFMQYDSTSSLTVSVDGSAVSDARAYGICGAGKISMNNVNCIVSATGDCNGCGISAQGGLTVVGGKLTVAAQQSGTPTESKASYGILAGSLSLSNVQTKLIVSGDTAYGYAVAGTDVSFKSVTETDSAVTAKNYAWHLYAVPSSGSVTMLVESCDLEATVSGGKTNTLTKYSGGVYASGAAEVSDSSYSVSITGYNAAGILATDTLTLAAATVRVRSAEAVSNVACGFYSSKEDVSVGQDCKLLTELTSNGAAYGIRAAKEITMNGAVANLHCIGKSDKSHATAMLINSTEEENVGDIRVTDSTVWADVNGANCFAFAARNDLILENTTVKTFGTETDTETPYSRDNVACGYGALLYSEGTVQLDGSDVFVKALSVGENNLGGIIAFGGLTAKNGTKLTLHLGAEHNAVGIFTNADGAVTVQGSAWDIQIKSKLGSAIQAGGTLSIDGSTVKIHLVGNADGGILYGIHHEDVALKTKQNATLEVGVYTAYTASTARALYGQDLTAEDSTLTVSLEAPRCDNAIVAELSGMATFEAANGVFQSVATSGSANALLADAVSVRMENPADTLTFTATGDGYAVRANSRILLNHTDISKPEGGKVDSNGRCTYLANGDGTAAVHVVLKSATLLGDVDLDGDVDAADAALLLRSVVSMTALNEEQAQNADVNADSAINAADAATILRSIVGMA